MFSYRTPPGGTNWEAEATYRDAIQNAGAAARTSRAACAAVAAAEPAREILFHLRQAGRFAKRAGSLAHQARSADAATVTSLEAGDGSMDPDVPLHLGGAVALANREFEIAALAAAAALGTALVVVTACARKQRYDTEAEAQYAADDVLRERGSVQHAYRCALPECGGFHLSRKHSPSS